MSRSLHHNHRRQLVELAGPAGVGKSALQRLLANDAGCSAGTIWGLPPAALLLNGFELVPSFVPLWLGARALLWPETRHIVRLHTLRRALASAQQKTVIFDEGPIFALAWLRGFGHPVMRSQVSAEWWRITLRDWGTLIDAVIVLDAPDEVLAGRIRGRPEDHEVKQFSDREIAGWMRRFRLALEWVLNRLTVESSVAIIRLDTSRATPEQLKTQARALLAEGVHAC
jgi:hypothetical protein